jgi:hypothetical protein
MERFVDVLTKIEDGMAAGDARSAFGTLRPWIAYPGKVAAGDWGRAMEVFARIARVIAGDHLAELAAQATSLDDVQPLYDLGYELIEQELFDIAANVLARAVERRRDLPGLVSELVAALERDGQHAEACKWLRKAPGLLEKEYVLRYLLAWNTAMAGDLEGARGAMAGLSAPSTSSEAVMYERMRAVLERADGIRPASPLSGEDLRGWHFVLHGAIVLRLSPHGFKEGMRGRYAFTQDSELRCREAIERMRLTLEAMGIKVPRVFSLPDRDSTILAIATARALDVPMEEWDSETTDDPGVIVAYDLDHAGPDLLTQLQPHRPGQVLWEHASRWVVDRPVAADLVTYVYQYNVAPWAERSVVDGKTGEAVRTDADDSAPELIGARIAALDIPAGELADRDTLAAFAQACSKVSRAGEPATGALRDQGLRPRQGTGGPVRSNRIR